MTASILDQVLQETPVVRADEPVRSALRTLLDSDLPALPVVNDDGRYAGVFGEREFMTALFPGYLNQLSGAAFLTEDMDEALEKRSLCAAEPVRRHMTTEHVDV
ncbi:MAG TPA: CBS domain-containing protein, partial [Baekduia sp.]|nr:CBS domain-containing protein [Baekduia sp.]